MFTLSLLLITPPNALIGLDAVVTIPHARYITGSVELVCLCFFLWDFRQRQVAAGPQFFRSYGILARALLLFANVIEIICIFSVGTDTLYLRPFRFARPFYLLDTHRLASTRRILRQILQTVYRVLDMLLLLLIYVLFWAVIVYNLLLADKVDPVYFGTLGDSYMSLLVALTTANYPDVMMSAFTYSRWFCVLFWIYMGLGIYFVLNIFLAVVFRSFQLNDREKFRSMYLHERRALRKAFQVVTNGSDSLSFPEFCTLIQRYDPSLDQKHLLMAFEFLDRINLDSGGTRNKAIELDEFYELFDALELKWCIDPRLTMGIHYNPGDFYKQEWLNRVRSAVSWADSFGFAMVVRFLIFANFIIIVFFSAFEYTDERTIEAIDTAFLAVYTIEATAKILRGGFDYFGVRWNVFDFSLVCIGWLSVIVGEASPGTAGVVVLARSVRLFRVLRLRNSFRHVLATMLYVFRHLFKYVIVVFCFQYMFAIIGMQAFHHTVSTCDLATGGACRDEHYLKPYNYQLNNFDNIALALNTLFDLLVVNNWNIIMEGHANATHPSARIYFVVYILLIGIIATSVVVSFILDAFIKIFPLLEEEAIHAQERGDKESRTIWQSLSLRFRRAIGGRATAARTRQQQRMGQYAAFSDNGRHAAADTATDMTYASNNIGGNGGSSGANGDAEEMLRRGLDDVTVRLAKAALYDDTGDEAYGVFLLACTRQLGGASVTSGDLNMPLSSDEVSVHVPLRLCRRVTSSRNARAIFRAKVFPLMRRQWLREASDAPPEELIVNTMRFVDANGDQRQTFVISLAADDAKRYLKSRDPDLRFFAKLAAANAVGIGSSNQTAPRLVYRASKRLGKMDVNRALWGSDLERWAYEQDLKYTTKRQRRDGVPLDSPAVQVVGYALYSQNL